MNDFQTLLAGSAREHGHLCPGQVIGVRMALLGLELVGLENPKETREIKKLIVYVEIDRCATDAISYVTGVKLGRRSLKFKDYGIMAATFVNLSTQKAFRIVSTESARTKAAAFAPHVEDLHARQLEAYKIMPLSELFEVQEVSVNIPAADMPGPSAFKTACESCGIVLRDQKEVRNQGRILCHACAGVAYYTEKKKLFL
ncbi:MAG: formylmethanofuran dehydrogenase [Proteobacteria bacterium]|nr:formylmethanofuran dehydrogenase [Desulfobacula sp.]MBU4131653.1 formylmethanofuran dehydrogenase [Pseudomonadota bacterium]